MSKISIDSRIIPKLYDAFEKLGATSQLLAIVGSIGDSLSDQEVIEMMDEYLSGNDNMTCIIESDQNILFDAEQKSKQNKTN